MPTYQIAVDAGSGQTNSAVYIKKQLNTADFASYRKEVKGDSIDASLEIDREIYGWNGRKYVVDNDAIDAVGQLDTIRDVERYGSEFHQFLVATAIAKLGIKRGDIDLILFAPPKVLPQVEAIVIENFRQNGGKVKITSDNGLTKHSFTYKSVTVKPEGLASLGCFLFDDNGNQITDDTLAGQTLIVDSGALTLDTIPLMNGRTDPDQILTSTDLGLYKSLFNPIAQQIQNNGGYHFQDIEGAHVEHAIRRGIESQEWYIERAGKRFKNLLPLYDHQMEIYTSQVLNYLGTNYEGLRQMKLIIPVGGGSTFLFYMLDQENLAGRIVDIRENKFTCGIRPTQVNAVGGLRIEKAKSK